MGTQLGSAGLMLVNSLIGIYLFILMLRFLLQASNADYYNPVSQTVVKITAGCGAISTLSRPCCRAF